MSLTKTDIVENLSKIGFNRKKSVGLLENILETIKKSLEKGVKDGKPVLGICLGIQIIMDKSIENNTECLGLVKGEAVKFPDTLMDTEGRKLKVPHMGWNSVKLKKTHPLFEGIAPESEFYFVHSYYPVPEIQENILGETFYGISFPSAVISGNLAALQFHPEKSGRPGLRILENFCNWSGEGDAE